MLQIQQMNNMNKMSYFPIGNSIVLGQHTIPRISILHEENEHQESSVFQTLQGQINLIEQHYTLKNPEEVRIFLSSNSDIIPYLMEAPFEIYRIFGQVPIYLELHHDPEEEWDELFIVIKTDYAAEKAVELEDRLFKEWFSEILDKVKGRLNFIEEPYEF